MKWIVTLFLFFSSATAFAGWTSSGGGLIKDANNPWFLKNVETVNYCIRVDEPNFGRSASELSSLVSLAIAHWKNEFQSSFEDLYDTRIATQTFVQQTCSNDASHEIDIVFQFGWLTSEQRKFLGDPTQYVGIAVRTDYDEVALRGKGFIYLSPQSGPDRMAGDEIAVAPWSMGQGGIVHKVLLHELGHVFGIPHVQSGDVEFLGRSHPALMAEDFAEIVVNKKFANHFAELGPVPRLFSFLKNRNLDALVCEVPWSSTEKCGGMQCVLDYFEAPKDSACLRFSFEMEPRWGGEVVSGINVSATSDLKGAGQFEAIGKISFAIDIPQAEYREVIRVRLTSKQNVVENRNNLLTIPGPYALSYRRSGFYKSSNSSSQKSITGHFEPNVGTLDAILNNRVKMNFVGSLFQ